MRLNIGRSRNKYYHMMKDFDILAINKHQLKLLYQQANFQKGIEMMNSTYVTNSNGQKFSLFVPIQQFQKFGPGMYLLFLFLKYVTIFYFIVSIFSFINLGLLFSGNQLKSKNSAFQSTMARTTLGNVQEKQLTIIIAFDLIITILFLIATIYWKQRQPTFVVDCCKEIMLPSYQTVVLKNIPQLYSQEDMKTFLEDRFGEIQDIYTVRNFNDDLYHYKNITKIVNQYKQERALLKVKTDKIPMKLLNIFLDYQQYYFKMFQAGKMSKYPKEFAFITFKSVKSRQQMLKHYKLIFPNLDEDKKQYYLYKGQQLNVKACLMQPNGINWQNLNLKKFDKCLLIFFQIFLLIIVLAISIIIIFIFYIAESSKSLSKYYGLEKSYILKINKPEALQSYCLGLSIDKFISDDDCSNFKSLYIKYTLFFIALPIFIAIFKFLLTQTMKALVTIRRHPYQIKKIQSQIVITFVFYFFASGILQYISFLQIDFQNGSTFSFFNIIYPIYKVFFGYLNDINNMKMPIDYNRTWYMLASYKIILISMISFNISSLGKIFYSFIRKTFCNFYARKQVLQCRMNYWLQGEKMEIQFVYAVAATIICFSLLFGASIPIIYPFIFIVFFILFWSTKFIFIKFCEKPLLYSHSMNSLMVKIIFFGIILHCFVSPLYFGAATIHSQQGIRNFLRIPHYGYYIPITVICLVYMLYRQRLSNLYQRIKVFLTQSIHKQQLDFQVMRAKKMSLPSKLCLIQQNQRFQVKNKNLAYSMHQNDQYEMILKTLYTINKQQRARATCVLNKQLYNLLQKDDSIIQEDDQKFSQTVLFNQLCRLTKMNYIKFQNRVGKKYSKQNNPYLFYMNKLKLLQKKAYNSFYEQQTQNQGQPIYIKSNSLKHLNIEEMKKSLSNHNKHDPMQKIMNIKYKFQTINNLQQIIQSQQEQSINRSKSKIQKQKQKQKYYQYQDAAESQIRLKNMSNTYSPEKGLINSISYLQTMSRVNNRRSFREGDNRNDFILQISQIYNDKIHQPPQRDAPKILNEKNQNQSKINQNQQNKVSQFKQKNQPDLSFKVINEHQIRIEDKNQRQIKKQQIKRKKQQIISGYRRSRRISKNGSKGHITQVSQSQKNNSNSRSNNP